MLVVVAKTCFLYVQNHFDVHPVQGHIWCWTRYTRKTSSAKLYLKCKSIKSASINVSFRSYIKYQRQRMCMSLLGRICWVPSAFYSHLFCSPLPPQPPAGLAIGSCSNSFSVLAGDSLVLKQESCVSQLDTSTIELTQVHKDPRRRMWEKYLLFFLYIVRLVGG